VRAASASRSHSSLGRSERCDSHSKPQPNSHIPGTGRRARARSHSGARRQASANPPHPLVTRTRHDADRQIPADRRLSLDKSSPASRSPGHQCFDVAKQASGPALPLGTRGAPSRSRRGCCSARQSGSVRSADDACSAQGQPHLRAQTRLLVCRRASGQRPAAASPPPVAEGEVRPRDQGAGRTARSS
jgi:hypothetical protein